MKSRKNKLRNISSLREELLLIGKIIKKKRRKNYYRYNLLSV